MSFFLLLKAGTVISSTTSASSDTVKSKESALVVGYIRKIANAVNDNKWNLNFLIKTVYSYYYTPIFVSKKLQKATHKNTILTTLYPNDPNHIITYRIGERKLKKWRIGAHDLLLDSVIDLPFLSNYDVKDIIFLTPQYLFIGLVDSSLKEGKLYVLKFLEKSLTLSNQATEGGFFSRKKFKLAARHEFSMGRMVAWKKQLVVIEPSSFQGENYDTYMITISKFYVKKSQISFDSRLADCQGFTWNFLKKSTSILFYRDQLGYCCFEYPFFTVEACEQSMNQWDAISNSEDGAKLFVHSKEPIYYENYDHRVCCCTELILQGKQVLSALFKGISMAPIGQFMMLKHEDSPYVCAYNARSKKTYHKVVNLGTHVDLCDAFVIDEYQFILITMLQHQAWDAYRYSYNLPFIDDRTKKGFGKQQVILMEWTTEDNAEKLLTTFMEEDEKKDDFVKRFYAWLKETAGLSNFSYLVNLLDEMIEDQSYRNEVISELKELKGYDSNFTFKNHHLATLKKVKKRLNEEKNNLRARILDYKVTSVPVYFAKYTGGYLVGISSEGVHFLSIGK